MDKNAFLTVSYGLYVVSSKMADKKNGFISNTVFQVSSDPALFAVASNKNNLTTEYILKSQILSISVLSEKTDPKFIGKFGFKSGRDGDKFIDSNFCFGKSGAPIILDHSLSYFDCAVIHTQDVGTHYLFTVKVLDSKVLDGNLPPMTYKYYREVIKGHSPKNAPTYVDQTVAPEKKLYTCQVCGHVYDPEIGDPEHGVEKGIAFDALSDEWTCPICGVSKAEFKN